MARKPTKEELAKARLASYATSNYDNDPLVQRYLAAMDAQDKAKEKQKDFSDVETGSSTKTPPKPTAGRTSLDRLGDAFTGGAAKVASDFMFSDVDAEAREKLRRAEEEERIKESILPEPLARLAHTDLLSRGTNALASELGESESYQSGMKGLDKYSEAKRRAVDLEVKDTIERNPIRGRLERMALDVAGSPQSLASIPGGVFAAIPTATTYNEAYRRMREAGASPEAAKDYAAKQATVEGGISAIPAGKFISTIIKPFRKTGITTPFRDNLPDLLMRVGKTSVGESAEEMVQTVGADLVNRFTAATGDEQKARELAQQTISKDLFNETLRAGAAGALGGAGFGGVHSALEIAKENAKLVAEANRRLSQDEARDARAKAATDAGNAREADRAARGTEIDVSKMQELLLPDEQRAAARQKLGTVNARIEATKQELADLNEQEYRSKMAEEAGETVEPFDKLRKARAGQSLLNLELAKNKLNDMLARDEQGLALQRAQREQEQAAAKQTFDEAPGTSPDLKALSTGRSALNKPPSKKKLAQDEAEVRRKAEEAELRAFAEGGTTATQDAPAGPSAARQLVQQLAKNRGTADAKRALSLLGSGRMEIVNSAGDVGVEVQEGMQYKGMEREGKIYMFADGFDLTQDLAPQLAATVFHEVKHAADFGEGRANLPSNLAGFIGMENATKINRKIEQAAARGNKLAQLAVQRAEDSGNYEEELVPHLISETKLARNKASGLSNVIGDIRNAVKSQYNSIFGDKDGVSVDDVFKLSEQLTDYVAKNQDFSTQPKEAGVTPDRQMLISGGTGADLALKEGRTYLSADGKRKYEIDDSRSRLRIPGDMQRGKTYKAKDILAHDELYKEMPELADVNVRFDDAGDLFGAYYSPETNTIVVNDKFIGPNANEFNSRTHQYVIHEMQHAAQKKAGSTNGASPEDFLTPEDRKIQQNIQNIKGAITFAQDIRMPKEQLFDLQDKLLDLETDFEGRMDVATKKYKKVLGEQEAYSTANRLPLTQKERQEDTSDMGRNLEQRFLAQEGELLSERGKRIASKDPVKTGVTTGELANPPPKDRMQMVKHGTPHTFKAEPGHAFGRFRDDKMGTGEGAQAFGWGHYLTEMWETAEGTYRKGLLERKQRRPEKEIPNSLKEAWYALKNTENDVEEAIAYLDRSVVDVLAIMEEGPHPDEKRLAEFEEKLAKKEESLEKAQEISDPEDRDWTTSNLAFEIKDIKKAIKTLDDRIHDEREGLIADFTAAREMLLHSTPAQVEKMVRNYTSVDDDGGEVYYVDIPEDDKLMNWDGKVEDDPRLQALIKGANLEGGMDPVELKESLGYMLEAYDENLEEDLSYLEDSFRDDKKAEEVRKLAANITKRLSTLHTLQNASANSNGFNEKIIDELGVLELKLRTLIKITSNTTDVPDSMQRELNALHGAVSRLSGEANADLSLRTGKDVYAAIEAKFSSDKGASKFLRSNGILGHYFQPPSRTQKTRNFVIYDEKDLKITGRDAREKGLGRPETRELRLAAQQRAEAAERASASKRAAFERDAREGKIDRFQATRREGEIVQNRTSKTAKKVKTIKGLFSAFGELGRELGVKSEEAVGEASYFADLAQITSLRIKRGTKLAAQRLVAEGKASSLTDGIAKMNARIKGTLDSLIAIEEEGRRQSAIAGLVREHPELEAIQDGYNMINDGTRQIVKQMLASKTGPLTDAEIKKMKTLITNQTRYLTRAYAAFQGADGKTWAEKLENEYSIAKAMVAKGKEIPEKYRESFVAYKAALDYVTRENVAVFDEDALSQMTLDKVRMVYDTWFSNRQGVEDEIKRTNDPEEAVKVKDELIAAIVARGKEVNATQISNRAHKIVNGLLGLNNTNNPVVTYYRGFKQDRSILMDRVDLPQELKDLFGEIEDPSLRIMLTISKQGELIARTNLLLGIKNEMYGRQIVSNEDKAEDNNDTFSEQLTGANWGPLEGHWVTPEVWSTIRDDREIATNMEDAIGRLVLDANAVNNKLGVKALSYYTRLAGLQKVAAIVWNPAQTIWNFGGSWITGIKEGNVNPANYARAGKAAAKLFAKELQAAGVGGRILQNDPDVEDLIRYDVIDSAMVQEIRKLPSQYIRQIVNDHGHVRNVLTKGRDISFAAVKQIFALSDLTVKIANYYHQVNMLESYYKAEGIEKPADTIKKEAANVIKDTNITFRRAAPIVKMGERAGLTYVMPYIQGVFRSAIYGYVHGMKDVVRAVNEAKTPKGKAILLKQGFGRIVGSTTAIFLVQALAKSVLTGDEEKDKKIRQIQMLDARYADSVYVGDDAKGNPMMLRWSRFDPLGPLTDLIRIAHSDATPEQKNRDMAKHMHELLIKPRLGQEILKLAVEFVTDEKEAAVKTKETKLERLFPQATQVTKDFMTAAPALDYPDAQAFMGVLDTMLPGATNIIDPNNISPTQWKAEDADTAAAKLLLATGGRLDTINPVTSAIGAVKDLDAVRTQARERVFEKLKTTDPTDRDAMKGIMDLLDDERKAFIRVKEVYEGMVALDMSKSQIDKILSDQARLSAHDRHLLYSGKYDTSLEGWKTKGSSVLSKKSITARTTTSGDKKPDPKDAEKEKEAIKKAVKALRDLGYKVKE